MKAISALIEEMTEYETGNPGRIEHFMKVYAYAKTIGERENIPVNAQYILEAAAVTHDIGIKPALEKYGSAEGRHQQKEGPPVARAMLEGLAFAPSLVERACYLIAHHHEYHSVTGIDYQILIEADYLVNICEKNVDFDPEIRNSIFKTRTGRFFFDQLFRGM
jgi:response regulator RpfG family c-di-GMP phosphodiesterase